MAEVNDSMVCKFVPRMKKPTDKKKKLPKKKKERKDSEPSDVKKEDNESHNGKSTVTLQVESIPSSRRSSFTGLLGQGLTGSGIIGDDKPNEKRNRKESGVVALMNSIPLIIGTKNDDTDQQNSDTTVMDISDNIPSVNKSVKEELLEAFDKRGQHRSVKYHEPTISVTDVGKDDATTVEIISSAKQPKTVFTEHPKITAPADISNGEATDSTKLQYSGCESTVYSNGPRYQNGSQGQSHQSVINYRKSSCSNDTEEQEEVFSNIIILDNDQNDFDDTATSKKVDGLSNHCLPGDILHKKANASVFEQKKVVQIEQSAGQNPNEKHNGTDSILQLRLTEENAKAILLQNTSHSNN